MHLNRSTMSRSSSYLYYNDTGNPILKYCVVQTVSTTLDTPEKAASWFRKVFQASGCVKGGLVPGNPGVYAWNFYVNPCFKTQLSSYLWDALCHFESDWASLPHVYYYTKEEGRHSLVRSNHPRHPKVTTPVDMEIYDQWDKTCSFHEFCMTLDPSLRDEKAKYLSFGKP